MTKLPLLPLSDTSVLLTGGSGLVGGAVQRHLEDLGARVVAPSRAELNLRDASAAREFFLKVRPNVVVACAARVGGIAANIAHPVDFLVENLEIQNSTFMAAEAAEVEHFVFMASSCIFPRESPQPMRESMLLAGPLEPTNESYAIAKLAGIQLARALLQEGRLTSTVLVPSNIYGPGDSFHPQRAHVTSALVRKFVEAVENGSSQVVVWGTGDARRELTHSSDLASAVAHVLSLDEPPFVANVGTGVDHSIREVAGLVAELTGFQGEIVFDPAYPDGMPQKVLDVSTLARTGWHTRIDLRSGVDELVSLFQAMPSAVRDR